MKETIYDDESTHVGDTTMPTMGTNTTSDKDRENNSGDEECSNSTEILSYLTQAETKYTLRNTIITQDEPDDNPSWTKEDWEGLSLMEITATVVVTPGWSKNQDDDSDWRSPCLGIMFGLFSGLTGKKRSSATHYNKKIITATGLESET